MVLEFESPDFDSKQSLLGSGYSHKLDFEVVIVVANKKAKVTFIIPPFFYNINFCLFGEKIYKNSMWIEPH